MFSQPGTGASTDFLGTELSFMIHDTVLSEAHVLLSIPDIESAAFSAHLKRTKPTSESTSVQLYTLP